MFVCACTHAHSCSLMVGICMSVCIEQRTQDKERHWVSCSFILCFISLKQSLSINPEFCWWPESLGHLRVSVSHDLGVPDSDEGRSCILIQILGSKLGFRSNLVLQKPLPTDLPPQPQSLITFDQM